MDPEVAVLVAPYYIARYAKSLTADELARSITWIEERKRSSFPPLSTANQRLYNTVLRHLEEELAARQLRLGEP